MGTRAGEVAAKQTTTHAAAPKPEHPPAPQVEKKAEVKTETQVRSQAETPVQQQAETPVRPIAETPTAKVNKEADDEPYQEYDIPFEDVPADDNWVPEPYPQHEAVIKAMSSKPQATQTDTPPRSQAPQSPLANTKSNQVKPSEHAVKDKNEAQSVWAKILGTLQKQDMFCYLFAKMAQVDVENGGLLISFAAEEKANYNVFSTDRGTKPLRESMRDSLGHMVPYRIAVRGTADGKPPIDKHNGKAAWQDQITRTAESLGIPIERKD